MGSDIKIGVDASRVEAARKQIDALKESLANVRGGSDEGLLGNDSLLESNELIRQISENITRMKSLVLSGENKGGILNTRQWEELGKVSGQINENLNSWADNINEARTALWKLTQEKERLKAVSVTNPEEWAEAQEQLATLDPAEKELRLRYDALKARQSRVERMEERAGGLLSRAGALDAEPQSSTGGLNLSSVLKATGIGYLAYKGFQLAMHGKSTYENFAPMLSAAAARGIDTESSHEDYGSLQTAAYGMQLSSRAGYTGGMNDVKLKEYLRWSRAAGLEDASFALSQSGALRNLFGKNDTKALNLLSSIAKATGETPERINPVLSAGFGMVASRQLSKELSLAQGLEFSNTFGAMRKVFGDSAAKDPTNYQRLQSALSPTGNKYYDLLFYKEAGMLDGPVTFEKINQMNRLMEADGALTDEGKVILARMASQMPDIHMARNLLATRLGGGAAWNLTDREVTAIAHGDLSSKSFGKNAYTFDDTGYAARMGNRHQRAVSKNALKSDALRYLGQRTAEALNPLEERMYAGFTAMADSDFAKWVTQNFGDAIDGLGSSVTGTQSGLTAAQLRSNRSTDACHIGRPEYQLPVPPPPNRLPHIPAMVSHDTGLKESNKELVEALRELNSTLKTRSRGEFSFLPTPDR